MVVMYAFSCLVADAAADPAQASALVSVIMHHFANVQMVKG